MVTVIHLPKFLDLGSKCITKNLNSFCHKMDTKIFIHNNYELLVPLPTIDQKTHYIDRQSLHIHDIKVPTYPKRIGHNPHPHPKGAKNDGTISSVNTMIINLYSETHINSSLIQYKINFPTRFTASTISYSIFFSFFFFCDTESKDLISTFLLYYNYTL